MQVTIQVLLILFFLYTSVRVFLRYRANEISAGVAISWILFWLLAAFMAANPNFTSYFAAKVGIGRGADLVVYVSLALIFYMLFRLSVSWQRMNKDITKLTRTIALTGHLPIDKTNEKKDILKDVK